MFNEEPTDIIVQMSVIQIRTATETDVPAILEMIRGLAEYEKLSHVCTATEEQLRRTLFGPRPGAEVLLATQSGVCAGFALFFPNYSTFLAKPGMYLEDLFVKPEARGRGVGLALLKRLASIARERDYGRVEWSVLDWNDPAIGFYKKLGAIPMDEWTMFRLTGDAIGALADRE
jgi:GNAT superfamily N-acetyltransferase